MYLRPLITGIGCWLGLCLTLQLFLRSSLAAYRHLWSIFPSVPSILQISFSASLPISIHPSFPPICVRPPLKVSCLLLLLVSRTNFRWWPITKAWLQHRPNTGQHALCYLDSISCTLLNLVSCPTNPRSVFVYHVQFFFSYEDVYFFAIVINYWIML